MSSWHCRMGSAALAWIAMTALAVAQPVAAPADVPTGDVWIAPGALGPFLRGDAQASSATPRPPTGDVWPAADGVTSTARTPAPRDAAVPEEVATGSVK